MDFSKLGQWGPQWLFMGLVLYILWRMIIWVMAFVKQQDESHAKERQSWLEIVTAMKQSIDLHNQNASEFKNSQTENNRFVREEHLKMLDNQTVMCSCLKEVEKCLGRINGYKE